MGYYFQPFVGASRGLLTLWDINEVMVKISMSIENLLNIKGFFRNSDHEFVIANVCAPCDSGAQLSL